MGEFQLDAAWRQRRRTLLREHLMAEAERQAARVSRSAVCVRPGWHGSCLGGTVCLCSCHDQPAARVLEDSITTSAPSTTSPLEIR